MVNALWDKDAEVWEAQEAFNKIEKRVNALREAEGITLPDDYNVLTHRLAHEDWLKMAPIAFEFTGAVDNLADAVENAARRAGCDISPRDIPASSS